MKAVLHFRSHAGLGLFRFSQRTGLGQLRPNAGSAGDQPINVSVYMFIAFFNATISGVALTLLILGR